MNEDNSQSADGPSRKTFLDRIGQIFQGDPKDKDDLVEVIRGSEVNDLIDHDTRDMLEGVIQIADMRVRDIMIPRSQMVTVDITDSLDQIVTLISDAQHSRYPIVSEDKDHVEGILLAKDLLKYLGSQSAPFTITEVTRPAVVVPESKRVDRLLKEFQEERYHMAIVVDEFGGVSGVVTIEDILEEIVGDIEDETDEEDERYIRQLSKHTFSLSGLTTIEDFNETFGTQYSDDEIDTVGGLVMTAFGHLPERGELVSVGEFQFKVTNSDNRRIVQLQVTIPDDDSSSEPDSP
ncbi:CNNM family magnesium/cobalt transport protein CorC [Vibrio sp. RC27]